MANKDPTPSVVLVTGGSGFLGQHVVGLLQEKALHVTEIRVLDKIPYINKLNYKERLQVKQFTGSINDLDLVLEACTGVTCVMHLVGYIDYSMFPDTELLNEINVKGTDTVIFACKRSHVQRLIYCSSVEVAIGDQDIAGGDETSTVKPENFLMKYAASKYRAERLVLMANGPQLTALSIRPVALYGEGDHHLIAASLKRLSKSRSRTFRKTVLGSGKQQFVYAGNVAWMFVCAESKLKELSSMRTGTETIGGEAFFACDDTPVVSTADFSAIFKEACGYHAVKPNLPGWIVKFVTILLHCVLLAVRLVRKVNVGYGLPVLRMLQQTWWFRNNKAKNLFGYSPLYNWQMSKGRSLVYYSSLIKKV